MRNAMRARELTHKSHELIYSESHIATEICKHFDQHQLQAKEIGKARALARFLPASAYWLLTSIALTNTLVSRVPRSLGHWLTTSSRAEVETTNIANLY